MEPRHVQLQGPHFSAKVPFVRFDPADWMLSADKAQTDYINIILENYIFANTFLKSIFKGHNGIKNIKGIKIC